MWPNPQEATDFVTFTEEILNGKLHFLCSVHVPRWVTFFVYSHGIFIEFDSCFEDKDGLIPW